MSFSIVAATYSKFCCLYSEFISLLEDLFLRRKTKEKFSLKNDGYLKIQKDCFLKDSIERFDFKLLKVHESFYVNQYHKKIILKKDELRSLIDLIFDREFCNFLTSQTGFKYSIDFFGAYQNFPIPYQDRKKGWYANHYHIDKPNSKNMLKIFIPLCDIRLNDGPLEMLSINQTKDYIFKRKSINKFDKIYLVGNLGDMFLCNLNRCLHKAGIPERGKTTKLIMIQLNPSNKWYLSTKIYNRQYKTEPKFTSFLNQIHKREILRI